MSNILNHNRHIFEFNLNKEFYWDFQLCIDNNYGGAYDGLTERCLSAYIEMTDDECIWFDNVYSKSGYVWENAVNNDGFTLNNFGYTSVDNGRTYYEKDKITNREFFELFTNTMFKSNKDDLRLELVKVHGNHQIYDYTTEITLWNNILQVAKLNGGWYQGFFCANKGDEYKLLPTDLGSGWNLEFVLNKEDFENPKLTMNDVYPENKGIFFYIGTRAENKWWIKYLTEHEFQWCKKTAFGDEYVQSNYIDNNSLNDEYFKAIVDIYESEGYFNTDYLVQQENDGESAFKSEYMKEKPCDVCSNYVTDEYYQEDLKIDENMTLNTEDGYDFYQPNIVEIKTDNKFVMFDRTCKGQKANKWDENTEFYLNYIKKPDIGNYFTLFHRGCKGYTANKIQEVLDIKNKEYNVLSDIYRNALAFQIKDDGTIGYKYLVKDCESEEENYKIESEFTKSPIIFNKVWYTVNVKIVPIAHRDKSENLCVTQNTISEKMQIYIYVNGKLVLVSKELPILNLKLLNDLPQKQEGVPFNISLGGGTQGLAETVYLNYLKLPEYVLPLEKEFGGSFVGYIKTFRFYTCPLNYAEIFGNYDFSKIENYLYLK